MSDSAAKQHAHASCDHREVLNIMKKIPVVVISLILYSGVANAHITSTPTVDRWSC